MSDWADKKISKFLVETGGVYTDHQMAQLLRDVQRETAEECCRIIGAHSCTCAKAIRARFGLDKEGR